MFQRLTNLWAVILLLFPTGRLIIAQTTPKLQVQPQQANANSSISDDRLKIIATRQNVFTIPFQIPQIVGSYNLPSEIRLYVTNNRGRNWNLYKKLPPTSRGFLFHAPADGEYWFSCRTVDFQGQEWPRRNLDPELKVLVDTVAPQVELTAELGTAGEIKSSWQIQDVSLNEESFSLRYQPSPRSPWKQVAVDTASIRQLNTSWKHNTTWWPATGESILNIQLEILDRAGNKTIVNRQLKKNFPDTRITNPEVPTRETDASAQSPANDAVAWHDDRSLWGPWRHQQTASSVSSVYSSPSPTSLVLDGVDKRPLFENFKRKNLPSYFNSASQSRMQNPFVMRKKSSLTSIGVNGDRSVFVGPLRMTRSRSFNIEYDVQSVGPSGVAKVELWATRDDGRHWESWGEDSDRQSPISVEVARDGVYGFRIVIHGGNGLVGREPKSGDSPDVKIGVDTIVPQARISSAVYGKGVHAGELEIHWQVIEQRLATHPVSLFYSSQPRGPWIEISRGLENTGLYRWRVDHHIPEKIYLRLEVRDEADNLGIYHLPNPIANDGLIPRGLIRGIAPKSN